MSVRPATQGDVEAIGQIAEASGLFPADMTADLTENFFSGADEIWMVSENGRDVTGLAFARPEQMADRVWNLLALAVHEAHRGGGAASALLSAIEAQVDARMIIIETTQLPEQAAARAFYSSRNYEEEGHVRDFYAIGEDKITFRKVLT